VATETIDGEVFELTAAGTAYAKGTNRPRALWILSKRTADVLDALKAYVTDQLGLTNAAVAALDAKVAAAGAVTGRRWTITSAVGAVTTNIGNINGTVHYRVGGWVPDTLMGDDGDWVSATDLKGGALVDSTGVATIKRAGVWQVTLNWQNNQSSRPRFGVRKNGSVVWIGTSILDSTDSGAQALTFTTKCAVNDTIDIVSTGGADSVLGTSGTGDPYGNNARGWVNTSNRRPTFQLVRLSA